MTSPNEKATGRKRFFSKGHPCAGLTVFETLIVCLIVSILITVVAQHFRSVQSRAMKAAMDMELANLRTAVRLYHMMNKRYPSSLGDLLAEKYFFPDELAMISRGEKVEGDEGFFPRRYLEANAVDSEGYPLDPYGRRYEYEPSTGMISPAGT